MIILGIESTCDETAAALVEDGRHLLSNVISTSVKEQALYGGVVPEIASRRHCEFISATVKKALLDAGKTIDDVDAVAVTFAPGLIGAVLVGVNFAKGLAYSAGQAAGAGAPSAGTHRCALPDPPGAQAALFVSGGLWRAQPHCRSTGLHPLPHSGSYRRRCCGRSF